MTAFAILAMFLIRCGPILHFLLLLRPSLPGAEESNDAGRDGEKLMKLTIQH